MEKDLIKRIQEMEGRYIRARRAVDAMYDSLEEYLQVQEDIEALDKYEDSGQWLKDYEADGRGEIPADQPRGVLSQDGLYDLLTDISALHARLEDYFSTDGSME